MLEPRPCDYSDVHSFVKHLTEQRVDQGQQAHQTSINAAFKNFVSFRDQVTSKSNTKTNIPKDIDVVMLI